MYISEAEREVYYSIIKKLIFEPCISQAEFVSMVIEQELGVKKHDDLLNKKTNNDRYGLRESYGEEYKRVRKQMDRLLHYLVFEENRNQTLVQMVKMPKLYDDILKTHQIELYNKMISELNETTETGLHFPLIEVVIPESIALKYLRKGDIDVNSEWIHKYYPYIYFGERDGFTYVECIILINIILTQHHRSLCLLKRLTNHDTTKDVASAWVERVVNNMGSNSIRRLYFDTFFTVLYNYTVDAYNVAAEEVIHKAWLPEKYRERVDKFNAATRYAEWQGDAVFTKGEIQEQVLFSQQMQTTNDLKRMLNSIIPTVWNTLIKKYKTSNELDNNLWEYEGYRDVLALDSAKVYTHIAMEFINASLDSAQIVLNDFLIPS